MTEARDGDVVVHIDEFVRVGADRPMVEPRITEAGLEAIK